jgi:hypothetical protein
VYTSSTAGGDNPPDREQSISCVPICELDPDILDIILDYIYSADVKHLNNPEMLSKMIIAADKFELVALKSHYFNKLMGFINEDNIGMIAVLAHRHNADRSVKISIDQMCLR